MVSASLFVICITLQRVRMEESLQKLSIQVIYSLQSCVHHLTFQNAAPITRRKLASNVYKLKTDNSCVIYM